MPASDVPESPPRGLYTLKQAAAELGISYKRARVLHSRGYFGTLARSGELGQGAYLVPAGVIQRLRNGEEVA